MEKQSLLKRTATFLLTLCLLGTTLLGIVPASALAETTGTDIYFLNSDGWASVGAYIYGDKGELLGSWGTTTATPDSGNWVKVPVSAAPPYSIIFYNTANDAQRAELYLGDAANVYVTVNAAAFASKEEAEATVPHAIHFLNSNGWETVGAYIYGDKGELLGSWGTTTATADSGNWVKVTASAVPPYSIIFYNTANDAQRAELYLSDAANAYVTVNAAAFTTREAAEASVAPAEPEENYLYFLNSNGWESVGAYIHGDKGELLGGWGTTTAVAAPELGEKWVKVAVSDVPPYNVIFYNKADDTQRAELYLDAADKIYVTVNAAAFTTREAAEASVAPAEPEENYLYFLNSNGWESVGAYIHGDKGELLGTWGTTTAVAAPELGEKWVKVAVSDVPPYNVIFYNKADDTQRAELYLDAADKIYVTVNAAAFTTREAAEASVAPAEPEENYLYFLNSNGWESVGVYIHGDKGELLGSWGTATAVAASELGEKWVKVAVSDVPPYNVIFYNKADDTQRAELYLDAAEKVYVSLAGAYTTQTEAEASVAPAEPEPVPTDIYFLNSNGWETVGAYIYGDKGELLGSWGTTTATADSGNWVKVTVSEVPPYNIIFFNTANDTQRAELYLTDAANVYVTVNGVAFATREAAEASVAPVEPGPTDPEPVETYELYFLNSNGWESVGAYIYGDKGELLGGWGTTTATADSGSWVKVTVSALPPYNVIFYNKADETQRSELLIDAADKIYVTVKAQAFATREAAEASMIPVETKNLYFLNSKDWESVGAYIYGDKGELLGSWGAATATAAEELGGKWLKVAVPGEPPYSVIFYNKADETQRAELLIDAADKIYVTVNSAAYTSQKAAEDSLVPGQSDNTPKPYTLYFLNSEGWSVVGAYIYGDKGELLGGWGSTTAVPATELGGNWVKVGVSAEPPYNVIFYNAANDTQRAELLVDAADKIYVTARAAAFTSKEAAERSLEATGEYELYFLNSDGWETVGAYIYGDQGELLGPWGSTTAVAAPELGENWMKVAVPALPPYNVIFYNTADETQRAELLLDAANKLYVTIRAQAFTSKEAAEGSLEASGEFEIYFLNSNGWKDVGAYIYGDQGELLGSWGSTDAVAAPELGEKWMKVAVPALPPYNIIFYNKADETQRSELFIDAPEKIYVTVGALAYATQEDAEAAEGVTAVIDPHNRDYGSHVEVIDTMEGKEPQVDNGISWLLPVGGAAVVVLAVAAVVLLKKKKQAV